MNIHQTCVQYFHRFRTHLGSLSWDDTAACVQISPSAAEPGGERANAEIKNWKILRKIRSSPSRGTTLVKAVQTLILAS